jgi:hypothetical protein
LDTKKYSPLLFPRYGYRFTASYQTVTSAVPEKGNGSLEEEGRQYCTNFYGAELILIFMTNHPPRAVLWVYPLYRQIISTILGLILVKKPSWQTVMTGNSIAESDHPYQKCSGDHIRFLGVIHFLPIIIFASPTTTTSSKGSHRHYSVVMDDDDHIVSCSLIN